MGLRSFFPVYGGVYRRGVLGIAFALCILVLILFGKMVATWFLPY